MLPEVIYRINIIVPSKFLVNVSLEFSDLQVSTMAEHRDGFINSLKRGSLILFKIGLALIFLILLIPIMVFFFIIFFLRLLVKHLAQIFRPDLSKMVTCVSNSCANIDRDIEKPRFAILGKSIFSGRIDSERILEIGRNKGFYRKNADGSMMYPEMQQYVTSWLGFRFWAQDPDFRPENHVHVVDLGKDVVTQEDLLGIAEDILIKPFHKHRSPWDVHVVHNVQLDAVSDSNNTAFFFRFSHILMDGFSFIKFLSNFYEFEEAPQIKTNYPRRSMWGNCLLPFKFSYVYADLCVRFVTRFPLKVTETIQKNLTKVNHIQIADVVPTQVVKEIKNQLGVGFTSTILGIVTGAMRSMILKKGLAMPEDCSFMMPFPKPYHPSKLRNHFTFVSLNLPVGEPDPGKRMKKCQKIYDELKSSAVPPVVGLSMKIFGEFYTPPLPVKLFASNNFGFANFSYIPVPWASCRMDGHELLDLSFSQGVQQGILGLAITVCCFKDRAVFTCIADRGILSNEDVLEFKKIIKTEVDDLRQLYISEP